jgi:pimeloyl-ACP methyl ester carboxylesterase
MKFQIVLIYLSLTVNVLLFGQSSNPKIAEGYTHFQTTLKKDTIDFVVADTNLTVKKPVLLFCQGSQPVPLFFDFPDQGIIPVALNNFDVNEMKKHYHVVVISMPKTPVTVGWDHLNKQYNYVLDTASEYSYDPEFVKADYLENYVARANHVLKYLSKQKWVDNEQLVIAGHSQGSHVALGIAHANKNVTQLGLFGFNPLGRIDQYIRSARKQAEAGEITWQHADSIQKEIYEEYQSYNKPDITQNSYFANSWKSFSKSQLSELVNLKIPVYIAYGSNDINSDFCDLLPLYFIEKGKSDNKVIRYPNLEHNFFPIDKNGYPDYQNGKWYWVMNSFISWSVQFY